MYPDAPILMQVLVAVVVIVVTALVASRLGLAMKTGQQAPMSSARFWWMLAVFMGPLGVTNRILFNDGLFLQLTLIVLIAGFGIWAGDRLLTRRR